MFIGQQPEWPNFTWDDRRLARLLAQVSHIRGLLPSIHSTTVTGVLRAPLQTWRSTVQKRPGNAFTACRRKSAASATTVTDPWKSHKKAGSM
jgi:hypothetical protein